jgi:cell wall-associated NlpC family hydrolase
MPTRNNLRLALVGGLTVAALVATSVPLVWGDLGPERQHAIAGYFTATDTGGWPSQATSALAVSAPAGRTAVDFARRQLGIPYRWGGTGAGGYDCSGLVQAAWRHAGVGLPRTSMAQARTGTRVSRTALRPGDLVFTDHLGHVQLYVGGGRVIEAPYPGSVVRYAPLRGATVDAYVRVTHAWR